MKKLLNFKLAFLLLLGVLLTFSSCVQEEIKENSDNEQSFEEMVEVFKSTIEENYRSTSSSEIREGSKCLEVAEGDCDWSNTTLNHTDIIEVYPGCMVTVTYDLTVCYNGANTTSGIFNYIITNFSHGAPCDSIQTILDSHIANHDLAGYKAAMDQFTLDVSLALEMDVINDAIALSLFPPGSFDCGSPVIFFGSSFELNNCFKYWIIPQEEGPQQVGFAGSAKCGDACCITRKVYCLAGSGKDKQLVSSILSQTQVGECDGVIVNHPPHPVTWVGECDYHFDCD